MRLLVLMLTACFVLSCGSIFAAALEQDQTAFCPPAAGQVKVDGNLDEVFWMVPPAVPKFISPQGRSVAEPTQAWAAYGKDGLYFAFECQQAKMSPADSADSKQPWVDDSVEVFVDVNGDRKSCDHFVLSAAGARMSERVNGLKSDTGVSPEWQGAAQVADGKWTAEIFVPYSSLGAKITEGTPIRANFFRNNAQIKENSCWNTMYRNFRQPEVFGNLIMGVSSYDVKYSANAGDILITGKNQIRIWCKNNTSVDGKLVITLYPQGTQLTSDKPLLVPAGKQLQTDVTAEIEKTGLVNLRVVFVNAATGARLDETSFNGTAVAPQQPIVGSVITSDSWGTLWSGPATQKIMQDSKIPAAKAKAVSISAAGNEFEPFQLVLTPKKQLTNVRVVPHPLTGPGGAKIDAWNVTARNVEYVYVSDPTSMGTPKGYYPDPLPEFEPFSAPAGQNSPVWLTVYVPAKTAPGDYKGTVDVVADGMAKLAVPVTVHVWGFDLPSVSKLRTAYGLDYAGPAYYQGAITLEDKRKLVDLYNLEFWRHRVAPYNPYAYYDIKASMEGGQIKLDFSDFDQAVQKYFPLFNSFMLPNFGLGNTAGLDMGADYPRLKVEYMRMVAEHLLNKGQLAKGYNYIYDEPAPEQYSSVVEEAKLNRMADQRIKVLLTEQVEPDLVGSVDIWSPIIDSYQEQPAKAQQAKGDEVWWYVCCGPHHPYPNNFIDYSAVDQRILPWISWKNGVNGILYWQTTYWRDNPYDTAMSYTPDGKGMWGNGDGRLLYPPVKKASAKFVNKAPVPSVRWEMIREGIEDYDYFALLSDNIAKAKAAGKSADAVAKAENALKLVGDCAKSRTEYTTDPLALEKVRSQVAQAIESLK